MAKETVKNSSINPLANAGRKYFEEDPEPVSDTVASLFSKSKPKTDTTKAAAQPAKKSKIETTVTKKNEAKATEDNDKKKKKNANQAYTIKVSEELKKKMNSLRIATDTKFEYQMLEKLIEVYYEHELDEIQKKKFDINML